MRRRWIVLATVAAVALVIGVLYGYMAGLAVVLAFATFAIFHAWWTSGGEAGEAYGWAAASAPSTSVALVEGNNATRAAPLPR